MYSQLISGIDEDGDETSRSYTPISKITKKDEFDLLVKVYFPNAKFTNGGLISQQLNTMKVGDNLMIAKSNSQFVYKGKGCVFFAETVKMKRYSKFSMVCGGTGITPMYQFIIHMMDETKPLQISLLFANKTEEDILLRKELEELSKSNKIKLNFALDVGNPEWKGYVGFVSEKMLSECFDKPSDDHLLMACGPPMMMNDVRTLGKKLGFKEENIAIF